MSEPKIVLSGGLGNQLFQYAYALHRYGAGHFQVYGTVADPRTNKFGLPELYSFNVLEALQSGKPLSCRTTKTTVLSLLKISSHGNVGILGKLFFKTNNWLGALFKKIGVDFKIHLGDGTGFFEVEPFKSGNEIAIGCFHSYFWASKTEVADHLKNLRLTSKPVWLTRLEEEALINAPVVVHIRRSDYSKIPELGFLNFDFFWAQMRFFLEKDPKTTFWVFSDDFEEVRNEVPNDLEGATKYIDFDQPNAAANLAAMRLGYAYILSNSTFSWWGAFLSRTETPIVHIPSRWYHTGKSPALIYPEEWKLIEIE